MSTTASRPRFAALHAFLRGTSASVETPKPGDGEEDDGAAPEGEEGDDAEAPEGAPEVTPEAAPEATPVDDAAGDAPPVEGAAAASFKAGVDATNKRWAGILTNANCLANLELATELAIDSNFSAEKIGRMCAIRGTGDPAALALLDRTTKPELGADANAEGAADGDTPGKVAGMSAVEKINQRRAGRGGRKPAAAKSAK